MMLRACILAFSFSFAVPALATEVNGDELDIH